MALNTQGFSLSALPRSPNIPANAGAVDVKAIYDGVREGLAALENVRRAPASMALADAEMKAKTAEAPLGTRQVLAQTEGIEQQTPLKTAILAADAAIAPEMAEAKRQSLLTRGRTATNGDVQLLNYIDGLRARVAEDPSDQRTRELLANAEAMANKKSAVTAADPQGATAANNTSREKVAAAGNTSREGIAAAGNTSREGIAAKKPLTGLPYILNRLEETRRALIENPEDEAIKLAYLDADLAFNKYSANSRADPTAEREVKLAIASQGKPGEHQWELGEFNKFSQLALDATNPDDRFMYEQRAKAHKTRVDALNEQSGRANKLESDQKIAQDRIAAQREATRATREQKMAVIDTKHQLALSKQLGALESLENNTANVDRLIDEAIALTGPTTAGLAAHTAFLPFGARTLRAKLNSIGSNVGFDKLADIRATNITGGGLGNVSDTENKNLQNTIDALDPGLDPAVLKANLVNVKKQRAETLAKLQAQYDRDLEIMKPVGATSAVGVVTTPNASNAKTAAWDEAKEKELRDLEAKLATPAQP